MTRTSTLLLASLFAACAADEEGSPAPVPDVPGVAPEVASPADAGDEDAVSLPPLPNAGPQPTTDGPWEWLEHDDGQSVGAHAYSSAPAAYYEYVRFWYDTPFEVRGLRLKARIESDTTLHAFVWDDFGGDSLALQKDGPLAHLTRAVTPADSGQWLELPIDPPLRLDPGRMIFAGFIVDGDGPRLMVDAGAMAGEGAVPTSLVWQSEAIDPATQSYSVFGAAQGDFLLRLEARQVAVVAEPDRLFEPLPEFAGLSRGALEDFDGDGDVDLMAAGGRLYRNDGGVLVDVSAEALPEGVTWNGGVFGDYDDDGDADWFGTGVADVLLRNDDGVFTDVTAASGIDDTQQHFCDGEGGLRHVPTEAAAWLDYDGDGLLDLYQGNFICWTEGVPSRDKLWRNEGDGTFTDVSEAAGIDAGQGGGYASRGLAPADYDGDGDMDLLVTNYRLHQNLHWRNEGDGTFTEVAAETGLQGERGATSQGWAYGHSIGATWGDFDTDGTVDVFVANLAHPRFFHFSDLARLYLGGSGAFTDVTAAAGIRYQETPSSPTAWDFDNDGDLDLTWTCVYEGRPSQFYRNDGPLTWTEISHPSGLVVDNGWGSVVGDLDDDGDLDYLSRQGFRNRNRDGRRALQVRPRGSGRGATNRSGFGARVTVTTPTGARTHELTGAHGTGCQDSPWLHFGLGAADRAGVVVHFPVTGKRVEIPALLAGRYTVHEDGTVETHRVGP